jgi:hypothetical protein
MVRQLITGEVRVVYGAPHWERLADAGGGLGRHRAPSAGVQTVSSVAAGFGRYTCGFRRGAVGFRPGSVECELEGAGRRWRRVAGTLPCRAWCRAGLDTAQAHGNAPPALDALGGQLVPRWHGQGVAHARSRAGVARGIVPWGLHGAGGEVTGLEAVGGALPWSGVLSGYGDGQSGVGCWLGVSAGWGRLEGVSRTASRHWGSVVEWRGRARSWQICKSGCLSMSPTR